MCELLREVAIGVGGFGIGLRAARGFRVEGFEEAAEVEALAGGARGGGGALDVVVVC